MAKKHVYQVTLEGTMVEVTTLKEVAEMLGRRVTKTEVENGEVEEVKLVEEVEETTQLPIIEATEEVEEDTEEVKEEVEEDTEEVEEDTEEVKEEVEEDTEEVEEDTEEVEEDTEEVEEDTEEVKEDKPDMATLLAKLKANNEKIAIEHPEKLAKKGKRAKVELEVDEDGNVVYPEVGFFQDENHIKKYYKQLTDEQIAEWIEIEGLEYNPNEHEGINRMRMCMAVKNHHFPKAPSKGKKKSKYADFTTEDLLQLAIDNDIEVKDANGNEAILRMYTIVALREAGLLE